MVLKVKEVEGAKGKGKWLRADDINGSDQPLSPDYSEVTVSEDSEDVEENEFVYEDLDGLLKVDDGSTEALTQLQHELPLHQRWAAHTLNLIGNTRVDKWLSSSSVSKSA